MATVVTTRPMSPWPRTWAVRARQRPRPGFFAGFVLPFRLLGRALRHPTLGRPFLRINLVRIVLVVLLAGAYAGAMVPAVRVLERASVAHPAKPVRGRTMRAGFRRALRTLGQRPASLPSVHDGAAKAAREGRVWLVWILAFLAAPEALVVFLSRRWDDELEAKLSALGGVRPEDESPKPARVSFDLRWVWRRMKKRLRSWLLFTAALPVFLALRWIPSVGGLLAAGAIAAWSAYWYGVATAGKSAHAWADEEVAPPPAFVRMLDTATRSLGPLSLYGKLWMRLSRSVRAPVAVFERAPAAFLGLALARMILSLPGLYFLARPIVPIAAGRLCAVTDVGSRNFERSVPGTLVGRSSSSSPRSCYDGVGEIGVVEDITTVPMMRSR